jgi:hypothetical protein
MIPVGMPLPQGKAGHFSLKNPGIHRKGAKDAKFRKEDQGLATFHQEHFSQDG